MSAFPRQPSPAPRAAYRSKDRRYQGYQKTHSKSRQLQKLHGDDRRKIPYDPDNGAPYANVVPEYVDGETYTKRELTLMAEALLRDQHLDVLDAREHPAILLWPMLKSRLKREIYVGSGTPDPSVESGLYWRTHPEGRAFRTPEEMAARGESFYR